MHPVPPVTSTVAPAATLQPRLRQAKPALLNAEEPGVFLRGAPLDRDEPLGKLPQPLKNCLVKARLPGGRDLPHAVDDLADRLHPMTSD